MNNVTGNEIMNEMNFLITILITTNCYYYHSFYYSMPMIHNLHYLKLASSQLLRQMIRKGKIKYNSPYTAGSW